jgi:hypothetical protein
LEIHPNLIGIIDLDHDDVFVRFDGNHAAIDAAGSKDFVVYLQTIQHPLHFFLPFLLGSDHEEVHDGNSAAKKINDEPGNPPCGAAAGAA